MINWIEVIKMLFVIFLICVPFILWMCKIKYATYVGRKIAILNREAIELKNKLHELERPTPRYPVFRAMTQVQYEQRYENVKTKLTKYQNIEEFIWKYLTWDGD